MLMIVRHPTRMLVGRDRVALANRFDSITTHRHATPAVVVGLERSLEIVAGRRHVSRAVLLAPGFSHAVEPHGGSIAVFLLPPHAASPGLGSVKDLSSRWVELGRALASDQLDAFDVVDATLRRERVETGALDDRLARALEGMTSALHQNVAVEDLAALANLSPSRLMSLARVQLGGSLRSFRRWLRMFEVARAYVGGASLTVAAHHAGFASSAHLSAAAREHFGIRPSDVLHAGGRLSLT
jgi:AraC-like DNA-binding protein